MKNLTASKVKKTPSPKLRVESKSDPSRTMDFIARHFKLPTEDQLKISDFLKNKAKQTERSSQALEYTFFQEPVFRFIYEPPYQYSSGSYFQPAVKLDGSISPMFELISLGDNERGEISLACIAGQNHYDLYRTGQSDSDIEFMFSKEIVSQISDEIILPGMTDKNLILVCSLELELPTHDIDAEEIYRLVPGDEEPPYYGLTGVTGNIYLQTSVGEQSVSNSENFLNKFATKNAENGYYKNRVMIVNCNVVPIGIKKISFSIRADIKSYVSRKFDENNILSDEHAEYALIDLRSPSLSNKNIIRNDNGTVKQPSGCIKVKRLQFSFFEPDISIDPSSNHDTD
jgi:hypothetical protein